MNRFLMAAMLVLGGTGFAAAQEISRFTANNMIHVVAHEMGHAVIREFDLPILTYEEAMADDFATLFVLEHFPERAPEILRDRMRSHLAEADTPPIFSEYLSEAQRAGRIVCLAYGTDPERFIGLAEEFGMEIAGEGDVCLDVAPEVARSWRRVLSNLYLPEGAPVTEVRLSAEVSAALQQAIEAAELNAILGEMLAQIDWHSMITLEIQSCPGSAGWRRNGRQIIVCSAYFDRFEALATEMSD